MSSANPLDQAKALFGEGRAAEALKLTEPLATAAGAAHAALSTHAAILKALRRTKKPWRSTSRRPAASPRAA